MLASTSRWLEGDGWAFEPKLDGWRALVHVDARGLTVYNRPGRDLAAAVPHLAPLAEAVSPGTVLDGELVAGSGRATSFYRLAPQFATGREPVTFVAFDVLAVEGQSVISLPYEERRPLLCDLSLVGPYWCTVPVWTDVETSDLLAACELQGVEGLVAKRVRSRYRPGRRSPSWVTMCRDTSACRRRRQRETIRV
jgi:bifunctional non-homologous end joining protein LigD